MPSEILCVDDEPSGLYFRKLILQKHGYSVQTSSTLEDALGKFQNTAFDLVVTDHLLGRASGIELARRMKELRPEVPIILLSGTADLPSGYEVADAFLGKTDGPEALLTKVRDLLSARNQSLDSKRATPIEDPRLQRVLLAAIVESSDDAIFSKSLEGTVLTWNRAAERMYGYSAGEIIGRNVSVLVPAQLDAEFKQLMAHVRGGDKVDHLQTRRKTKDGRELAVVLTVFPVRDEQGHILAAATIARDVTQITAAQQALRNTDRLATAGRMAATVAHEINNPLEAVTNILYLLDKAPDLNETVREFLQSAQQEVGRIRQIAQLTLKYHRQATAKIEQVRISELVDGILKLYGRRLQVLGVAVDANFKTEGIIFGYAGEIRQVISNLVVNAIDALEQKGTRVRIRIRDAHDRHGRAGTRLIIADDAGGIPAQHLPRIFDPFYSTKGDKGTGVGLWVSKGIIDKHNGSIRVKSRAVGKNSGTVFSVFLPREFSH